MITLVPALLQGRDQPFYGGAMTTDPDRILADRVLHALLDELRRTANRRRPAPMPPHREEPGERENRLRAEEIDDVHAQLLRRSDEIITRVLAEQAEEEQ